MSTLAKRLDQALKHAGITAYRLAEDTKTDKGTVSRTLAGESARQEHTTIAAWAKRCGVRMEWLSTGEGPMVRTEPPQLRDRPEWPEIMAQVRAMHPELSAEDVELVGESYDHPRLWPGPLDAVAIATTAAIQRDFRARLAARGARTR